MDWKTRSLVQKYRLSLFFNEQNKGHKFLKKTHCSYKAQLNNNNRSLEYVETVKFLGMIYVRKLNWKYHIGMIIKEMHN